MQSILKLPLKQSQCAVSTTNKTHWDQREQARRLYATSHVRKKKCDCFHWLERNDIMWMCSHQQIKNITGSTAQNKQNNPVNPWLTLWNDTHLIWAEQVRSLSVWICRWMSGDPKRNLFSEPVSVLKARTEPNESWWPRRVWGGDGAVTIHGEK